MDKVRQKIIGFRALDRKLHAEERPIPRQDLVDEALSFVADAKSFGLERMNAFVGFSGEVQLVFHHLGYTLEITLEADGSITLAYDCGDVQLHFQENVSKTYAIECLSRLRYLDCQF